MTRDEIKKVITAQIMRIAPEIEEAEIDPSANLQRSLEIDSFDFLKILTALNELWGVEVPEADYGKVDTLEHMAEYFATRVS